MEKKYQVFVSSTYSDLKEERYKVIQTIMNFNCFPAGMELFPAMDEEQMEYIKKVIDDCDYYILIIGARYGSIGEDGISYTEKEYDYAVSSGIPILAFLHNDINDISFGKTDKDDNLYKKLLEFRAKVEKNRLIKYWNGSEDLIAKVSMSLPTTIKMRPRIGWVKANLQSNAESLQEINNLQKKIEEMRNEMSTTNYNLQKVEHEFKDDISGLEAPINFTVGYSYYDGKKRRRAHDVKKFELTLKRIFVELGAEMLDCEISETTLKNRMTSIACRGLTTSYNITEDIYIVTIETTTFQTIKYQLKILGLIENCTIKGKPYWKLTYNGMHLALSELCILRNKNEQNHLDN